MQEAIENLKDLFNNKDLKSINLSKDGKIAICVCDNRFYIFKQNININGDIDFIKDYKFVKPSHWDDIEITNIKISSDNKMITGTIEHFPFFVGGPDDSMEKFIFIYRITEKTYSLLSIPNNEEVYCWAITDTSVFLSAHEKNYCWIWDIYGRNNCKLNELKRCSYPLKFRFAHNRSKMNKYANLFIRTQWPRYIK